VKNPASGSAGLSPLPAAAASSSGERKEFSKEEKLAYALKKHEEKQLEKTGGPLVDYYGWLPNVNDKGKPLSTIENVAEICHRLNITIRYNVISKEEEILIPGAGFSLDNRQNASLSWLMSECAKFRMPVDRVPDYVTYLADQNQYNPVAEWVMSKPWDGRDHLAQLIATVKAKGEGSDPRVARMKSAFITRWMISAVAAAFRPHGVSAHGVLVFQGSQYIGKTKWFKSLVPDSLGVLKDGLLLRPDDRDSVMKCVSNWLVELGEIDATFRKSDVAALKSFLTSDRDVLRRAYARKESAFARRTVFFASVNPKNYLHDETGNRRYWTIECEQLDYNHSVDMQQCWAQVYEQLFVPGESWFLTPDELDLLNLHNEDFTVIDPIEEVITRKLRWSDPDTHWRWTSATDILVTLGRPNCTKAEVTKAGIILRKLNGDRSKRTGAQRLLLVPDTFSDTSY
jgi:putative DNA primase/helicase